LSTDQGGPGCGPHAHPESTAPTARWKLRILGASGGALLLEHEQEFADRDPVVPFWLTWKPLPKGTEVGRIDLKVSDAGGAYKSFALFPWSVYIPHEEVNFATDSASIAPAETPKLQASLNQIADALAKHKNLGPIKLYIAGHTDTVGAAPYNLGLSRKRAQSIAGWFRKNGLRIPIAYEGFGEFALAVATPDNTTSHATVGWTTFSRWRIRRSRQRSSSRSGSSSNRPPETSFRFLPTLRPPLSPLRSRRR